MDKLKEAEMRLRLIMNRRSFLGAILATAIAPAIVRADSLTRVMPRNSGIPVEFDGVMWWSHPMDFDNENFVPVYCGLPPLETSGDILHLSRWSETRWEAQ